MGREEARPVSSLMRVRAPWGVQPCHNLSKRAILTTKGNLLISREPIPCCGVSHWLTILNLLQQTRRTCVGQRSVCGIRIQYHLTKESRYRTLDE